MHDFISLDKTKSRLLKAQAKIATTSNSSKKPIPEIIDEKVLLITLNTNIYNKKSEFIDNKYNLFLTNQFVELISI